MFPGHGAQVYYNEAGEPLGWDYPSDEPDLCPDCGLMAHAGNCRYDPYDNDGEAFDEDLGCYNCGDLLYKEGLCRACFDKQENLV